MKSILIYTFHTYPYINQLRKLGYEIFVLDQELNKSIEELKVKFGNGKYSLLLGIADNKRKSKIESKAVNKFNKDKYVIKGSPSEYKLHCPSKEERKALLPFEKNGSHTASFCNYAMYKIQHFITVNSLTTEHMFIHINFQDIDALSSYLFEVSKVSSPLSMIKRGRAWNKAYLLINIENEKEDKVELWLVGVYCLIQALEIYLKAYIAYKNPKYLRDQNLRKDFNHNIRKLIQEVGVYGPKELYSKLLVIYKNDLPLDINGEVMDFTELRYGYTGQIINFNIKSTRDYHLRFEKVFNYIDDRVSRNFSSYYDKYLKEK